MTHLDNNIENRIKILLEGLKEITPRDTQSVAQSRARFLAQAELIAQELQSKESPESNWLKNRLIDWMKVIQNTNQRKDRKPMITTLVSFLITMAMILGSAGATVFAAQGSTPDDPLYQVKMLSEELQLKLAFKEQTQLKLALKFADNRGEEIATLVEESQPIPAEVQVRMQQQNEFALQLAAGMEGAAMHQALEQIRTALQQQERMMAQLQAAHPEEPIMEQIRLRIQEQLRLVEMGLSDPQGFLVQIRTRSQIRNEIQQGIPGEPPDPGSGGNGNGQGQPPAEPPQGANGTGPGPQGPQVDPGSGNGTGPGPVETAPPPVPPGDNGNGPGQPPEDPGSGNGDSGQGQPPEDPGSGNGDNGQGQPPEDPGSGNGDNGQGQSSSPSTPSGSGNGDSGDGGNSNGNGR